MPSGLNATAYTQLSWSSRDTSAPVAASNTRALPSPLPVATRAPSGLNATACTSPPWSSRDTSAPVAALNTRALRSLLPVATRAPSELNATAYTRAVVVQPGYLGAGRRVEHPRAAVSAAGGHPGAVRAERHRIHPAAVVQPGYLGAGRRVEHPRAAIATAGGHPGAVRAERHRMHLAVVVQPDTSAPVAALNTRALPSPPGISPLPAATRPPSGLNATAYTQPPWSRRLIWRAAVRIARRAAISASSTDAILSDSIARAIGIWSEVSRKVRASSAAAASLRASASRAASSARLRAFSSSVIRRSHSDLLS